MFGRRVRRVEDDRLLRGQGLFVDDLAPSDALHMAVVRSPHARARIRVVDTTAAARVRGVVATFVASDFGELNGPHPHPTWVPPNRALGSAISAVVHPESIRMLATADVRFDGEPVAVVVARDRYIAEDAARLVDVQYDVLPALVDPTCALAPDAPLVQTDRGTNLSAHFTVLKGDPDGAFRDADLVVSGTFTMARQTGVPLEPRGVLAVPDRRGGVSVWSSTQAPYWLRDALVRILGFRHSDLRVVAPDVGGGFGVKSMVYPEELLVVEVARRLGRGVRWTETRIENLRSAIHSRDQQHQIALALRADGKILAVNDNYLVDAGASNVEALSVPYNTAAHLSCCYAIPSMRIECTVVLTNKAPLSAYRGAGRPEAVFAMERVLDRAARSLGIDPVEIRRRNVVPADEMPYRSGILYKDGTALEVDGADFQSALEQALGSVDYPTFRTKQAAARSEGRYLGLGIGTYIEGTGRGPFETASVRVVPSGEIIVTVALSSQGQGHETFLGQLVCDALGVGLDRVRVVQGDTLAHPAGGATIASRTAVVVGNAVHIAAHQVRRQVLELASHQLEVAPRDLALEGGRVYVVGSSDKSLDLGAIAASVEPGRGQTTDTVSAGLQAVAPFEPGTVTFASGVHIAVVEVDPSVGSVIVRQYVVVHDCGRVINPAIVDGQVQGGVAQGIGGALLERLVYDENGQLTTATLTDYRMPTALDIPAVEIYHQEAASSRNPLGVKGVGEAGSIPVPAAVIGAVEDALSPFGISLDTCPLVPGDVTKLVQDAISHPTRSH